MAIDLSNQKMKQGALEALNLILQSRSRKIKIEPDPDDPKGEKSKLKMPKNIDDTPPTTEDEEDEETSEAKETRLDKIEQDMSDPAIAKDLKDIKDETAFRDLDLQKEQERIQGQQDEFDKMKAKTKEGLADFSAFIDDLNGALRSQMRPSRRPESSYAKLNPSYAHSQLLAPGEARVDKKSTPKIQIYFDQSGSWGESDIKKGMSGLVGLEPFERRGDLELLPPLYFSNDLYDNPFAARADGGTHGFSKVLRDIKNKLYGGEVDNVIIMSDNDLDDQTYWYDCVEVEVRGCVWWLWRDGKRSKKIVNYLTGQKGSFQYRM